MTGGRSRRSPDLQPAARGRAAACRRCTRRVLHVDPHEDAPGRCVGDNGREERPAEIEIDLQPESGGLHGDVRVEVVAGERVECRVVGGCDGHGLVGAAHLLAEHVDRGELAFRVQGRDGTTAILERGTRDVGRGKHLDDRPGHSREEPNESSIRDSHCSSILRGPPTRPSVVRHCANRRRRRCREGLRRVPLRACAGS